ncbi:hypothetical protein [Aeromicrobium wangtongii]|uniref:Uncharacterized protein n=1 Tax=Aeromicrobium wangtongii TaxID=2969247 RepID=A0ABY5M9L2_9ACTN|nr:hypothetical protein [Aeromicrobium wangtongii]MCD9199314.1 hypothetical protein [Aeromicrobium wangtongii]UUP13675.1 hypothetical protein NQV15_17770 [Aeromicrobium wangtongii]
MSSATDRGPRSRTVDPADDWRLLLPPTWLTIPTEPEAGRVVVSRLIDRMMEGKPRDALIDVRVELDRTLRRQLADAARAGATHVHALSEPLAGVPVSASLTVSPIRTPGHPDELASALNLVLGDGHGVLEHGYAQAGSHPALRRVRRVPVPQDLTHGKELMSTCVDYVVPTSDRSVLLLAFSTTTWQIEEELVALFDAIASTLHQGAPA